MDTGDLSNLDGLSTAQRLRKAELEDKPQIFIHIVQPGTATKRVLDHT